MEGKLKKKTCKNEKENKRTKKVMEKNRRKIKTIQTMKSILKARKEWKIRGKNEEKQEGWKFSDQEGSVELEEALQRKRKTKEKRERD